MWPDNLPAVNLLIAMSTQWRSAGYGPTGLDYGALPSVLELMDVPRAEWPDLFECLRVLESEALNVMGEQT